MPRQPLPDLVWFRLWRACAVIATGAVIVLSVIPNPPSPPSAFSWDKLQHATAYALLAAAWYQSMSGRARAAIAVGLLLVGAGVEVSQAFIVSRYSEFGDMIANALGVLFGFLVCLTPLGRMTAWMDARLAGRSRSAGRFP